MSSDGGHGPSMVNHVVTRLCSPLAELAPSASIALADRVRALRAAGRRVLALQTGEPDFSTPDLIVHAGRRALAEGLTRYTYSRGLPELREAVAARLAQDESRCFDPDRELLITCGGVHAYACALMAVVEPGGEVLVPDPAWMTHASAAVAVGGVPVRVPSASERLFWPELPEWESRINARTRAFVVNSPNNPTGSMLNRAYLTDLCRLASERGVFVISDEVYSGLVFDGRKHVSVASLPAAAEIGVLVNSFSKTYAMTGWRVGYLAGPADVMDAALKASQNTITNVAAFSQQAALCALTSPQVTEEARAMRDQYEARRNRVLGLAREAGQEIGVRPDGAFYFFLDIRALGLSSADAADRLLSEEGVAMVPGSAYGRCGEGFLRMTFAAADEVVEEGFTRFLAWMERQHRKRGCNGPVVESPV